MGGVEQSRPRRQRIPPVTLRVLTAETVGVTHVTGSSIQNYNLNAYYPMLDHDLAEMKERFSDVNLGFMKAIDSLCPKSKHFLQIDLLDQLLQHYSITSDGLEITLKIISSEMIYQKTSNTYMIASCDRARDLIGSQ